MSGKLARGVELSANIAIITVSVLLGVVLAKHYLLTDARRPVTSPELEAPAAAGVKLTLPGMRWGESRRTLLLALSSRCRYCTESAGFYKRLAEVRAQRGDLRLVAVLPQGVGEAREYLDRLGVKVDEVKQSPLDSLGATGTPTLILVDGDGVVLETWVGKLPPDREAGVLDRLLAERASG